MPLSVQSHSLGVLVVCADSAPLFTARTGGDLRKPFLHPLITPEGTVLTADAPAHAPGHRGIFFGWADVNGVDFWNEADTDASGRITTESEPDVESGDGSLALRFRHTWRAPDGQPLLHEVRRITTLEPEEDEWRALDWQSDLQADDALVTLGNTQKAMGLSFCAAEPLAHGRLVNSRGQRDAAASGRAAEWLDYTGALPNGAQAGLTLMAARTNPHPRPEFYAQAEPLGFLSASFAYRAPFVLAAGERVTLRYRLILHDGPADVMLLQTLYTAFLWG